MFALEVRKGVIAASSMGVSVLSELVLPRKPCFHEDLRWTAISTCSYTILSELKVACFCLFVLGFIVL